MTIWNPEIAQRSGPTYRAIADALAEDIETGDLRPGDRLPTHRDLAARVGVTLTTVTRAYAEAERRGLTEGTVGGSGFIEAIQRACAEDPRRFVHLFEAELEPSDFEDVDHFLSLLLARLVRDSSDYDAALADDGVGDEQNRD